MFDIVGIDYYQHFTGTPQTPRTHDGHSPYRFERKRSFHAPAKHNRT